MQWNLVASGVMTHIAKWKITMFHGEIHYFNGDFQLAMLVITRGYVKNNAGSPYSAKLKTFRLKIQTWTHKQADSYLLFFLLSYICDPA